MRPLTFFNEVNVFPVFSKVQSALKGLKNNKAAGTVGILGAIFKYGVQLLLQCLYIFICNILETGSPPAMEGCQRYHCVQVKRWQVYVRHLLRDLSLLSIAGQIFAQVMLVISNMVMPDVQYGFRKDVSTTDFVAWVL